MSGEKVSHDSRVKLCPLFSTVLFRCAKFTHRRKADLNGTQLILRVSEALEPSVGRLPANNTRKTHSHLAPIFYTKVPSRGFPGADLPKNNRLVISWFFFLLEKKPVFHRSSLIRDACSCLSDGLLSFFP